MTTKHQGLPLLAAAAAIVLTASPLLAQKTTAKHETREELQAEAKIPMETARSTALAHVKDGTVKSEELEREHGRLVYSFDISQPGRPGVDEVNVDAKTGKLVGRVKHESAATERKEARAEAAEKTATAEHTKHEMKTGATHTAHVNATRSTTKKDSTMRKP
jgi:hypothetical protein